MIGYTRRLGKIVILSNFVERIGLLQPFFAAVIHRGELSSPPAFFWKAYFNLYLHVS